MEPVSPENQTPNEPIAVPSETPAVENTIVDVPAQDAENAAPAVPEVEAPEKEKNEEIADEEKKTEEAADEAATYEEEEEEEEEEVPEPEEEEWVSDEEVAPRRRGRRAHNSEDEDEEYGRSKRRKVMPVKKAPRTKTVIANESAGMKALRQYTSALKLGPRCFRGINKIMDTKEREATLISRLHDCGRSWSGEYPSEEDILLAKEETRQKKADKARQYIIEEEDGVRSSRKAAQKARDFVKNLGEEDEDGVDEEIGGEVDAEIEDMNDEE